MAQQNPPSYYYRPPRPSPWDPLHNAVWWLLRGANLILLVLLAGGVGVAVGSYTGIARVIPNVRDLGDVRPGSGSRIVSADGELLATLSVENRQFISIDRIPKLVQEAAVAIEDRDFYRHPGVDPRGIVRALYQDVRHRGVRQGGSTITQQLARNLYLTQKRTLSRKLAEAVLAVQLERAYTKPEILELYLNQIYFGEGAYGIQVAAKTYFRKNVWDLGVSEAAMLMGLARAPERYSPFKDEELAIARRNLVLEAMRQEGFIDAAEAEAAKAEQLHLSPERKPLARGRYRAPYFVDYVIKEFADQYGADALYRGDYTLYTTLNMQMQEAAEAAVREGIEKARQYRMDEMALVAVDVHTGAIKAMVGGQNYAESQYNRAGQGRGRPAGSSFKPFVYTAALLQGYTPDSIVTGAPISYPNGIGGHWTPGEYGGGSFGRMTARVALAKSSNRAAVNLANAIGIRSVIEVASKMGIPRDEMQPVLPLAIGYCRVTPLEMASAFSIFATGGYRTEPYSIRRITDARGRTVDEHKPITWRVLEPDIAEDMVSMLTTVVQQGTAAGIRNTVKDFPAAGKTGTSSNFKDAWFVGFTPDLSAAVWTGTDQYTSGGGGAAGGRLSAPVWAAFMVKAQPIMQAAKETEANEPVEKVNPPQPQRERPQEEQPPVPVEPPPSDDTQQPEVTPPDQPDQRNDASEPTSIVTKRICPDSGMLAGPYCPDAREISYDTTTGARPPDQVCTLHRRPETAPAERKPNPEAPRKVTVDICYISKQLATPYCPIVVKRTFNADEVPTQSCTRHGRR